ncbi:hypothetical protein LVB77_12500 [Lysobacter sp. 5GHs7-4]|uniref:hypothetical protein n=1 Tax=Lysobacter sp. 5GHs7-4 TaxID=2904253 RepID=UPI001E4AFF9E|nr:hypothetical protein [Lysobacter sp. 5GHs7-4]UHQ21504.1 hypothetical protein LVB77_12500 [Lysobacter sp. 5GHs7-4]
MRGALAAASWLVAMSMAAFAPMAVASEPGVFCLDRAELTAKRKNASPLAQQYIYSETSTMGPMIAGYERTLVAAERGDKDAQRRIGGFWAACVIDGDGMSAQKQATAATYLSAAAKRGDTQAMRYLALFHVLGSGVPADYTEAYRHLAASGYPKDAVAQKAAKLKLTQASPAEQEAMFAFVEVLPMLLQQRLEPLAEEIVHDEAMGRLLSARIVVNTCPNRAQIQQADEGIDQDALLPQLQALMQRLPSAGLPCSADNGQPNGILIPFSIKRR